MKATKKILSMAMALLLLLSVSVPVLASDKPTFNPTQKYKEQVYEAVGWSVTEDEYNHYHYYCMYEYNADNLDVTDDATSDYAIVHLSEGLSSPSSCYDTIGNYSVRSNTIYYPYEIGYHILSTADSKLYTLAEAYKAHLPNIEYALNLLGNKKYNYRDIFEERLELDFDPNGVTSYYDYKEVYSYCGTENTASTPDYVLVFATRASVSPGIKRERIGEFAVVSYNYYEPYELGYFVYVPSEDKIYTLREAYDSQIKGIEKAFMDSGINAGVIGDVDKNTIINVKDATLIQKSLAEFEIKWEYKEELLELISDFNRDGVRNIKDATAIQKHIAGLEY